MNVSYIYPYRGRGEPTLSPKRLLRSIDSPPPPPPPLKNSAYGSDRWKQNISPNQRFGPMQLTNNPHNNGANVLGESANRSVIVLNNLINKAHKAPSKKPARLDLEKIVNL